MREDTGPSGEVSTSRGPAGAARRGAAPERGSDASPHSVAPWRRAHRGPHVGAVGPPEPEVDSSRAGPDSVPADRRRWRPVVSNELERCAPERLVGGDAEQLAIQGRRRLVRSSASVTRCPRRRGRGPRYRASEAAAMGGEPLAEISGEGEDSSSFEGTPCARVSRWRCPLSGAALVLSAVPPRFPQVHRREVTETRPAALLVGSG